MSTTVARAAARIFVSVALAAALVLGLAATASAETRRIAVVVGSNRGAPAHADLRFAEQDAARLSNVLVELGGLLPSDTILLQGPSPTQVLDALEEAARRVTQWHGKRRGQAVLLFYFSGHSDGQVLELGSESLAFATLRQHLSASGADVRLVIIDSCRSGALFSQKGGTLGQPFDIRLADDLASTGEALIASSAADESALESSEIGASFFSHHLVSGLRGAADASGDGLVTLAEAFQYAAARTLRATTDTLAGPQHPAYDFHLAGRGELVLTELRRPWAILNLPESFDRLLLLSTVRTEALVELGPRSARRIALPPGRYQVRAWRGSQTFGTGIALAQGQEMRLAATELLPMSLGPVARKGDGDTAAVASARLSPLAEGQEPTSRWAGAAAVGLSSTVAKDNFLGLFRLGLERRAGRFRAGAALLAGTGHAARMRESHFGLEVGPSWWTQGRTLRAGLGLGLGGGLALQRTDGGRVHFSGMAWAAPTGGVELRLDSLNTLSLLASVPVTLLRQEDRLAVSFLPSAWVGFSRAF